MMCEFHDSNSNGFGDIGWTDKLIYFSSIDSTIDERVVSLTSYNVFSRTNTCVINIKQCTL